MVYIKLYTPRYLKMTKISINELAISAEPSINQWKWINEWTDLGPISDLNTHTSCEIYTRLCLHFCGVPYPQKRTQLSLNEAWTNFLIVSTDFYTTHSLLSLPTAFSQNLKKKMTGSPGQTRPLMWINMTSSWEKICKLIFSQILVCIWWHWVNRGHFLLILGGTGLVLGGTDWTLIVLGW